MDIEQLIKLGFNCMPINSDKTPTQSWKEYQDKKINSISDFKKDTGYYALITGFNDVECIDIDLKVITDFEKCKKFKKELFSLFRDNIEDFQNKVVIKKTRSGGYHVIYRAKNIEGNNKLAKIKGYKEAVIETRGIGGYICMYNDVLYERDYNDINLITNEERDIIISCCKIFHEEEKEPIQVDHRTEKKYNDIDISPWQDYNEKNRIWDLVCTDFNVVKKTHDKIIIRRHGASSPHSGYIYQNSNCMYLFSTGTIYPAEKLISPFAAYAIKEHQENYSKAASELYLQGYGSRKKPSLDKKIIQEINKKPKLKNPTFPIEIYPAEIQSYITESARTLNLSTDYMGCALLWACSLMIGNSLKLEIKRGWYELGVLWIAIVGDAGVGKSPSLNQILFPLFQLNSNEIKRFQKHKEAYNEYEELDKKDKELAVEVEKPKRTQFIVDDVTIEALINLHSQNKNSVGVFKDELAGWFKDMNKYKEGSDKEQWLSSWSGRGISVDRITRQSDYIASPFMPVLGGIQPTILESFFTDENRDSGFFDRMLFSYPEIKVEKYNESEIKKELIDFYRDWVFSFFDGIKKSASIDDDGEVEPIIVKFAVESKKEWIKIFNKITEQQNSNDTTEFLKSMLPKQKSYIPRFALLLNTINFSKDSDIYTISKKSIVDAYKLSNYFIRNNEKMILTNAEVSETNKTFKFSKGNIVEKLRAIVEQNPNFNKAEIAKKMNISRTSLYNYLKKLEQNDKT